MFVCTANTLNIPPALLDRMEVIRIPGYTEKEKNQIAKRYLVPKQIKNHGIKKSEISFNSNLDKISEIFVNQGPGKISSIRNSIAIAKGIAFAKNIDLYGFLSEHLTDKGVDQLIKIDKKNFTNINLIKPLYSS